MLRSRVLQSSPALFLTAPRLTSCAHFSSSITYRAQFSFSSSHAIFSPFSSTQRYFSSTPSQQQSPQQENAAIPTNNSVNASVSHHHSQLPANATRAQKIWAAVKEEAHHYWVGTKLLWADMKIASKLLKRLSRGEELTRTERRALMRTAADMLRLVPFAIIVIIPFAEFALPFLLKLFPNMLPSTYTTESQKEEKRMKAVRAKLEVAEFLQETTELMANKLVHEKTLSPSEALSVQEFQQFMDRVRHGLNVSNEDIVKYSKLFSEDFTLDTLSVAQLQAMCRLLGVSAPIGLNQSDFLLKYQLRQALQKLREDDREIEKEGITSLTEEELREACADRGIHPGKNIVYMRKKLKDWLDLSLHSDVPISLLVLSRAFSRSLVFEPKQDLANTLGYLSEAVVKDTEQEIVDRTLDEKHHLEMRQRTLEELEKDEKEKEKSKEKVPEKSAAPAQPKEAPVPVHLEVEDLKAAINEIKLENQEVDEDLDVVLKPETAKPATPKPAAPVTPQPTPAAQPVAASQPSTPVTPQTTTPTPSATATATAAKAKPEEPEKSHKEAKLEKVAKTVDKMNEKIVDLVKSVEKEVKDLHASKEAKSTEKQ